MATASVLSETITSSNVITATSAGLERTIQNAVDLAKSANGMFRSHQDVAVALPGGMFGHVRNGKLIGFGLEPIGEVLVDSHRKVTGLLDGDKGRVLWGRVAAVAGGTAAAVSSVAGVASILIGRRRSAESN
jgi:hypothetical protein